MSEHEDSMLERICIDNYKRLVNFELPLQALSLLLGRNGMGKTAVLDVAFGVRRLLSGAARVTDADAFPTRTLTRWQDRNLQSFEMDVALGAESFRYRLEVEHERATRQGRVRREELTSNGRPLFGCDLGKVQLYRDDHSAGPQCSVDRSESALARVAAGRDNRRLTQFRDFVNRLVVCGLHCSRPPCGASPRVKTHCCSATHTTSRIGIGTSRSSVLTSSRRSTARWPR